MLAVVEIGLARVPPARAIDELVPPAVTDRSDVNGFTETVTLAGVLLVEPSVQVMVKVVLE